MTSVDVDDQCMVRLQSGDSAAWGELHDRHARELQAYFRSKVHDSHFADDLVQDTLLSLGVHACTYDMQGKFKNWLYRIGRNLMLDRIKRLMLETQYAASIVPVLELSEDDQVYITELRRTIHDALNCLSLDLRITVVLHFYCGMTLPDISDIMECPVSTSKSRMRLAREQLARQFSEDTLTDIQELLGLSHG